MDYIGWAQERRPRLVFWLQEGQPESQLLPPASTAIALDVTLPPIAEGTRRPPRVLSSLSVYISLCFFSFVLCPFFSVSASRDKLRCRFDCLASASPRLASPEAARDTADGCRQGDRGTRYQCILAPQENQYSGLFFVCRCREMDLPAAGA